jgi:hypothetical protein
MVKRDTMYTQRESLSRGNAKQIFNRDRRPAGTSGPPCWRISPAVLPPGTSEQVATRLAKTRSDLRQGKLSSGMHMIAPPDPGRRIAPFVEPHKPLGNAQSCRRSEGPARAWHFLQPRRKRLVHSFTSVSAETLRTFRASAETSASAAYGAAVLCAKSRWS